MVSSVVMIAVASRPTTLSTRSSAIETSLMNDKSLISILPLSTPRL